MYSRLFESILNETKVNAARSFTKEEAEAVVDQIKSSIKKYNFKILDRDKNLDFMHNEHLNKETSMTIIDNYLEPKNLVAVLNDRNDSSNELYLFSMNIPIRPDFVKHIYLKVDIKPDGKVTAISWHKQTERMQIDYRQASDGANSSFLERMGRAWKRLYNNMNSVKITDCYYEGDYIIFTFDKPVNDDDDDIVQSLARSVPKDYGYRYKDVLNNISFEHGDIKVYLKFGHF